MFGISLFGETDEDEDVDDELPTPDVGVDTLFEALRNERRRRAVRWVNELNAVDLTDLAETVACEEYDCKIADLTGPQRKRVYVSLYQTHIPKLEQMGIVDVGDDQEVQATAATEAAVEVVATAVEVTGGDA
ncbi:DUF7344 domain-containing protein [Halosimplex sp. J119]